MNFDEDPELAAFRQEVRAFLKEKLPPDMAERSMRGYMSTREDTLSWQRTLYERGWGAPHWPSEYGGPGWPVHQIMIFEEECVAAGTPERNIQAISTLSPAINAFGTPEQRARFIPPILKGEVFWCQGFSEPGSGSDLASLRTRATREGDHYVINGQKIWTSLAQWADWIFMLVRTDNSGRRQEGITMLLVDMKTPGITIRPIVSIDGCHHLNETFYDNVRVPVENRIGEENRGWNVAKFLLGNERVLGSADLPGMKRLLAKIKRSAARETHAGEPLIRDTIFASRLANLEIQVLSVEMYLLRMAGETSSERGWASASFLKARCADLHKQLSELLVECLGETGNIFFPNPYEPTGPAVPVADRPGAAGVAADFFFRRAKTIAGGSSEVQRNIIARALLG